MVIVSKAVSISFKYFYFIVYSFDRAICSSWILTSILNIQQERYNLKFLQLLYSFPKAYNDYIYIFNPSDFIKNYFQLCFNLRYNLRTLYRFGFITSTQFILLFQACIIWKGGIIIFAFGRFNGFKSIKTQRGS